METANVCYECTFLQRVFGSNFTSTENITGRSRKRKQRRFKYTRTYMYTLYVANLLEKA